MKFLLMTLVLAFSTTVCALECENDSYVVTVDPNGTATKAELMHVIRVISNYQNGVNAGDLHIETRRNPVLSVNFDAGRGEYSAFQIAVQSLQVNPGVVVTCTPPML